ASDDGTVRVWDTKTGAETLRLRGQRSWLCWGVAFSPDGSRLACGVGRRMAKVWDAATGRELVTLEGHGVTGGVATTAFSPDGTRLAAANGDGRVDVWETATGRSLLTARGGRRWGYGVAFSPDGKRFAAGADDTVKLWDLGSGRVARTLKGHGADVNGL